jgi:hypothetical protein
METTQTASSHWYSEHKDTLPDIERDNRVGWSRGINTEYEWLEFHEELRMEQYKAILNTHLKTKPRRAIPVSEPAVKFVYNCHCART